MATPNMGIDLPVEGADPGVWDDKLNDALELKIDPHDHSPGKGVLVPSAGIGINAALPANGFAITNLQSTDYADIALPSSGARRLFWVGNNLYGRNASGQNVQITSGAALAISASGGFGAGYVAAGAEADFDDASDFYTFKQQVGAAVRQWGGVATGGIDLYELKAHPAAGVPVNRVRISSPAALAASYAVTMPAALPGSTLALQLSAAGLITASNSFASSLVVTGGVAASGVIAADGGLTSPAGQSVTLAGDVTITGSAGNDVNIVAAVSIESAVFNATTAYRHSFSETISIPPMMAEISGVVAVRGGPANAELNEIALNTSVAAVTYPIPLRVGQRIKTVVIYIEKNSAAGTITAQARVYSAVTGAVGLLGSDTEAGVSPGKTTLSISGLTTVMAAGSQYYIRVTGGGTTGDILYHAEVSYDRVP